MPQLPAIALMVDGCVTTRDIVLQHTSRIDLHC
jgi:hypothetical protein